MKRLVPVAAVSVLIVVGAAYFIFNKSSSPPVTSTNQEITNESLTSKSFKNPKKSAHYESNTPEHSSILAAVPINVVINFNFDLAKPSEIKIEKDQKDFGVAETEINNNKLSMRREMDPSAPDGIYTVNYNACWPDGSCHDGNFQFAIDRAAGSGFDNLTGQNQVIVKMSQIKFMPQNVKISKGTTVTWINDDKVEHYVNTDSHPAHTYYLEQNSKALKNGQSYSQTFDTVGIYPYHCSAHAESMAGAIIVE